MSKIFLRPVNDSDSCMTFIKVSDDSMPPTRVYYPEESYNNLSEKLRDAVTANKVYCHNLELLMKRVEARAPQGTLIFLCEEIREHLEQLENALRH